MALPPITREPLIGEWLKSKLVGSNWKDVLAAYTRHRGIMEAIEKSSESKKGGKTKVKSGN